MLKRILTAVVALAVLVPILLFAPYWAVQGVFALLAAVAVYEIAGCVGLRREWALTALTMLFCVGGILAPNLYEGWLRSGSWMRASEIMSGGDTGLFLFELSKAVTMGCVAALTLTYLVFAVVRHRKLPVDRLLTQLGMTAYVALGFWALCRLTCGYENSPLYTRPLLWVALCIPWVADTLAYFTGYFLGKRKLCPEISPKKTVEGAIGGVVGTGAVALVVYGCVRGWDSPLSLLVVFCGAMLLAVVSIFGDLFASLLKRHFGVKDYGFLFPGHGGVLDRFDSTIPVALVLWALVIWAPFGGLL